MFKAKRIDTGEIETILAVDYYDAFHQTYFFVWSNNAWRWRPAHRYVPPNVNPEDVAPINVRTELKQEGIPQPDLMTVEAKEETPF